MKQRKYSDKFVGRQIDRVDQMRERALSDMTALETWDMPYRGAVCSYDDVKKVLKNRGDLRYVDGFWAGWVLAKGDPS